MPEITPTRKSGGRWWGLTLGALGVVYGDIGTSPLYAFRECFMGHHNVAFSNNSIMGILSTIFWVLIVVISIKYMAFVLRADNRGEGGILSLMSLASPGGFKKMHPIVMWIGIFGAALLYGDGAITPAISVLSAVEGLTLVAPHFSNFVVPITIAILVLLFWVQSSGTGRIGAVFGPIILLWFTVLGLLGLRMIVQNPAVLQALNPQYAFEFFSTNGWAGFLILGSVFLVVTGGEALYADMGHFGKAPIRLAWFTVVLPGLVLNYFGQGALLLSNPAARENPFFLLAPSWALLPLVILSTMATVIASQALISGVYSLTRQAIQLGFSPRMQVVHTSHHEMGQIYMPQVNWALLVAAIYLVLTFRSSSNLAGAYGISVSTTMVITTLLLYLVARHLWKWPSWILVPLTLFFLIIDFGFLGANLVKIADGGWFPLALGAFIFVMMTTWRRGRQILAERMRAASVPLADFMAKIRTSKVVRIPGVSIFMVGDAKTTPPAMLHNVRHNKVLHETVIVLTVLTREVPLVGRKERVLVEQVAPRCYRVIANYGFMDFPSITDILSAMRSHGLDLEISQITYFLGRETIIASKHPGMAIWREHLFAVMSRNAQRATAYFNLPADQVIEVGIQVEI